jgi:transposase-like protein
MLREPGVSQRELMKRYSVSKSTILKWQRREDREDRLYRPHILHTTLPATQEMIVIELRRLLELPLDDLLAVTRRFIDPDVSRSDGQWRTIHRPLYLPGKAAFWRPQYHDLFAGHVYK